MFTWTKREFTQNRKYRHALADKSFCDTSQCFVPPLGRNTEVWNSLFEARSGIPRAWWEPNKKSTSFNLNKTYLFKQPSYPPKKMSRPGLHWFLPNCDNFATRCPVSGPWLIRPPGCPLPPGLGGLRSNYQLHMPGAWCAWSRETNLGSRAENFFQGFDPICRERDREKHNSQKTYVKNVLFWSWI